MIMRAMLEDIAPRLAHGKVVHAATVGANIGEGAIAAELARLQGDFPSLSIGSYPSFSEGGYKVQLVVRGRDAEAVEKAAREVEAIVRQAGAEPQRVSPH